MFPSIPLHSMHLISVSSVLMDLITYLFQDQENVNKCGEISTLKN